LAEFNPLKFVNWGFHFHSEPHITKPVNQPINETQILLIKDEDAIVPIISQLELKPVINKCKNKGTHDQTISAASVHITTSPSAINLVFCNPIRAPGPAKGMQLPG
jgi:hypothetical protein